jgi:predicted kinase
LHAPAGLLEARIVKRQSEASDASQATLDVLQRQREEMEALNTEERELAMDVSSDGNADVALIAERILRGRPAPWRRRLEQTNHDEH